MNEDEEWNVEYNDYDDDEIDESDDENLEQNEKIIGYKIMFNSILRLRKKFEAYCKQLPVIGFNSSRYDLNLIKHQIAKVLKLSEGKDNFVIKKTNSYMAISMERLKFLDICQYLAPGSSYSKFFKAYIVEEAKSYFPYCWFDSAEKLNDDKLPSYDSFFFYIKGFNTLEEGYYRWKRGGREGSPPPNGVDNYWKLLKIWRERKMAIFQDFLIYYNNLDVKPFIEALTKFRKFYQQKDLDVFKISISIPGIERKLLFRTANVSGAIFPLFPKEDRDLHALVKKNICGSPSIIFNRYHKADAIRIRSDDGKLCKRIIGLDANSIYLFSLAKKMPQTFTTD